MRRTDEILNRPFENNGAYNVPEGYFSTLNRRIMDSLPQQKEKPKSMRLAILTHWKYAVAACLTGVILGIGNIVFHFEKGEKTAQATGNEVHNETISDEYVDEFMDYAMINNHDVYQYLAEQQ